MAEEGFDLVFSQVSWVAQVMEADEASYPVEVTLFSAIGVVFQAERLAGLVE